MYIKVRVYPKSKKEEFIQISPNRFEIKVKEKAERNIANLRIREILAENFETELGNVKIVNGHHSPLKLISINID